MLATEVNRAERAIRNLSAVREFNVALRLSR
jgi:hypothetical protein